ncbi:MAG: polyprenyl synthetase family protein [Balneola sp.]|nr:MAG: polyprenyl synthetase family protein [Balneola sp.]
MSHSLHKELLVEIESGLNHLQLPQTPETLYQSFKYALNGGGKRIRPILSLLGCGMCGGQTNEALPAAIAVEILHNFTLVHDDIMDSAETRRGRASVYKKWDQNIAILGGDVMFAKAAQQLGYYGNEESYSKKEFSDINEVFLNSTVTVCEGQALDMEFVTRDSVSHEEYLEMIAGKTAALLSGALEMGGIAGHASPEQRGNLKELGLCMGLAFQIQDDLLDATADPERFGKKPGGDIFEGKKTYLTILALERADEDQSKIINETLDAELPTEESVNEVLSIFKKLNVLEDAIQEISDRYNRAYELLANFSDSKYKTELKNLLIFLQNRDH